MVKINFKDIAAQFINRIRLMPVTGETNVYDTIPVRGMVTESGTPIRAAELNQMQNNIETAIGEAVQKVNAVKGIVEGDGAGNYSPVTVIDSYREV